MLPQGIFRHIDSGKGKRLFFHCHAHCKATCSKHDETGIKSTRSELTTLSRIRTSIRQTLSDSALNDYLAQRVINDGEADVAPFMTRLSACTLSSIENSGFLKKR
ncbi:hypothetical protein ACFQUX_15740 [Pantoea stewartii]